MRSTITITCSICGARCACKGSRGGICCGCHRHNVQGQLVQRVGEAHYVQLQWDDWDTAQLGLLTIKAVDGPGRRGATI